MLDGKVILADEPSGSLDSQNKQELHQLFFELREELGQTFIIVTHDEGLAAQHSTCVMARLLTKPSATRSYETASLGHIADCGTARPVLM